MTLDLMSRSICITALLASLAFNSTAWAVEPEVASRTYLLARETQTGNNVAPIYEYLDLEVTGIANGMVEFRAGGWGRNNLGEQWTKDESESSLNYGYLSFKYSIAARADLGRFFANEGVISEHVDGIKVNASLPRGIGLKAFAGKPVENDSGDLKADALYGGRLAHHRDGKYEFGLAYLTQKGETEPADREEIGWDLWLQPMDNLHVQGISAYNYETPGWMEHGYYVMFRPISTLGLTGEYTYVDYEHFFTNPTLGVFEPDRMDRDESVSTAGLTVDSDVRSNLKFQVIYKIYTYEVRDNADYFGAEAIYGSHLYTAGLSVHRMQGKTDELRYSQFRAYASRWWGESSVTLDYLYVGYDEEIYGVDTAHSLTGAATYAASDSLFIGGHVEYSENPFFEKEIRGLVKVIYNFSPSSRKTEG